MFSLRTLVPLLAITFLLAAPAEATTSYYTGSSGETSFNTAVAGLTLMDLALTFSGTPGSTGLLNASGTGIDFLGFNSYSFNTPSSFTVTSGKLTGTINTGVITIDLPATGVYAFGTHIAETSGTGNWCIDLTPTGPCAYNVFSSGSSDAQFFGFVSDTAVTAPLYIHPLSNNPVPVLTNFEAFDPAAVPESRTMLLVGLGLVTLLTRRKIRQPV
jgi:hypothetical protein